ncbi:hypothetical protein TYRP_021300 [Tyrophagus putrescentiae]|nr:hypothetical protein TYRP_021300 [Tyrophagus putrescentiae]
MIFADADAVNNWCVKLKVPGFTMAAFRRRLTASGKLFTASRPILLKVNSAGVSGAGAKWNRLTSAPRQSFISW